jgi:hypothetical protein
VLDMRVLSDTKVISQRGSMTRTRSSLSGRTSSEN